VNPYNEENVSSAPAPLGRVCHLVAGPAVFRSRYGDPSRSAPPFSQAGHLAVQPRLFSLPAAAGRGSAWFFGACCAFVLLGFFGLWFAFSIRARHDRCLAGHAPLFFLRCLCLILLLVVLLCVAAMSRECSWGAPDQGLSFCDAQWWTYFIASWFRPCLIPPYALIYLRFAGVWPVV